MPQVTPQVLRSLEPLGIGLDMKVFTAAALSLCALGSVAAVAAGQVPAGVSQSQLQQMLLQNPDLVRQRLLGSGLSPDQIRARLRAAGYPENLLDSYLGSSTGQSPSQIGPTELAAIEALGLAPGDPARHRVEELVTVDRADRGAVGAANVVGLDLEAGDRVGVRLL